MDGRLGNVVDGLIVSAIAVGLAALVAGVVWLISKRKIGTATYYICAIVVGYVLYRALIVIYLQPNNSLEKSAEPSRYSNASVGLDAPFIAPPESQLESFPVQLDVAIASLPVDEKAALTEALEYLFFATAKHLEEKDPAAFHKLSESDLAAKSLAKLYHFTESQGSAMTLRKYIELSEEFKKQEPESWEMFKAGKKITNPQE
jgi:hypothetical protein